MSAWPRSPTATSRTRAATISERAPSPYAATLQGLWPAIEPLAHTIQENPRDTIRPSIDPVASGEQRAIEVLGRLRGDDRAALLFEGVLGRGGTGEVRLATQTSLGRKVAVKGLRQEARSERNARNLMHEAWVTGAVEHPNVVPVYDMGLDEDGQPLIVLKRIDGVRWSDLIADPDRVASEFGVDDPLEWHLRTLMQVCTAVHFAHSRGVVHRDLKPDNVMVGSYGEVYVLDWGIAVSLREDPGGRLPSVRQATRLAGTPCYMAPEMLGEDPPRISERTDVYLLGATLYEAVCQRPPHDGPNVTAMFESVLASQPTFPPHVSVALADLIRKALAARPEDRYQTADALRAEVQRFLDHRGSARLASQAERRVAELEATDDRVRRYKLYGECRFGFRQALDAWPDNQRADDGMRWATRAMVEYELDRGDPSAAASLLADLDAPAPDLAGRVRDAEAAAGRKQARIEDLERMDADHDLKTGARTRAFFAIIMGALWVSGPLLREIFDLGRSYEVAMRGRILFLVVAAALTIWARDSMTRTAPNRRLLATLFFTLLGMVLIDSVNMLAGTAPLVSFVHQQAFIAGILTMATIAIDRRLWPSAIFYAAAFTLSGLVPETANWNQAAANLVVAVNMVWVWGTDAEPRNAKAG